MSLSPENTQHHTATIEFIDGVYIITCPICSLERHYDPESSKIKTIDHGDMYASHSGSIGGLQVTSVEPTQKDYLDVFRNFINEHL